MFDIIPFVLIIFSLAVLAVVVVRKFSVLANLDVENMPAEKEAKFKEKIIGNRIKRGLFKYTSRISRISKPVFNFLGGFFKKQYNKLVEIKETPAIGSIQVGDEAVAKLYAEAEDLYKQAEYEAAEKKLIDIIGQDSKNIKAFRLLGEVYYERKDYSESKQTLQHAQKLLEKDYDEASTSQTVNPVKVNEIKNQLAGIYFDLAATAKAMELHKEALAQINKALDIEPNNPRYLDIKIEISIINKDKALAELAYDKLKEANPENQKLKDLRKEIDKM